MEAAATSWNTDALQVIFIILEFAVYFLTMFGDEKALTLDLHCHKKHIFRSKVEKSFFCQKKSEKILDITAELGYYNIRIHGISSADEI